MRLSIECFAAVLIFATVFIPLLQVRLRVMNFYQDFILVNANSSLIQ